MDVKGSTQSIARPRLRECRLHFLAFIAHTPARSYHGIVVTPEAPDYDQSSQDKRWPGCVLVLPILLQPPGTPGN